MSFIDFSQSVFRKLRITSIFGFAGNLATNPLDLEINDEQPTDLLASPLFPQEREGSADRSQVYHSQKENLMTDSSRLQSSTGDLLLLVHSESEKDITGILEEQRQQILSDARSEIWKQERRAEKAEADIRALQQQIRSNQIEFSISHEESRNEQARLLGILSLQERALREAHIQGIQELKKLRGSQVSQIDELSRQQLQESQSTIEELMAQIGELQERVNFYE